LLDGGEPQDDVGMVFATSAQRGKTIRERTVQPNENLPCGWIDRLGVDALRQCRRDRAAACSRAPIFCFLGPTSARGFGGVI
jgi:hypothetical protein